MNTFLGLGPNPIFDKLIMTNHHKPIIYERNYHEYYVKLSRYPFCLIKSHSKIEKLVLGKQVIKLINSDKFETKRDIYAEAAVYALVLFLHNFLLKFYFIYNLIIDFHGLVLQTAWILFISRVQVRLLSFTSDVSKEIYGFV